MALVGVGGAGPVNEFSLKNVATKTITAFSVSESGILHVVDCMESSALPGIAPGATYVLRLARQDRAATTQSVLHLLAVVFDDGVGEGVQIQIDRINAHRLGRIVEAERVRGILAAYGSKPAGAWSADALASEVGGLPASPQEALSSEEQVTVSGFSVERVRRMDGFVLGGFFAGVRTAREDAMRDVDQLRTAPVASVRPGAVSQGAFIAKLRESYEGLCAMNQKYLVRLQQRGDNR
jgi:hypothetical protein